MSPAQRQLEGKIPLSLSASLWVITGIIRWNRRIKARAIITKVGDKAREYVRIAAEVAKHLEEARKRVPPATANETKEQYRIRKKAIEYVEHLQYKAEKPQPRISDTKNLPYTGAALAQINLPRDVRIYPGAYFYIFFPPFKRARGVPLMAYSWESSSQSSPKDNTLFAKALTFLIKDKPALSSILTKEPTVILDGPYGQDLRLERFSTIILIAEGIGISSILPIALSLAQRKDNIRIRKDRVRAGELEEGAQLYYNNTTKVTLIWAMDNSAHINWVIDYCSTLVELDKKKV